jgi:hypothetical protein
MKKPKIFNRGKSSIRAINLIGREDLDYLSNEAEILAQLYRDGSYNKEGKIYLKQEGVLFIELKAHLRQNDLNYTDKQLNDGLNNLILLKYVESYEEDEYTFYAITRLGASNLKKIARKYGVTINKLS